MNSVAEMSGRARPLAVDREIDAMIPQDANQQIDVCKIGDVLERQAVFGQKARDQQGQCRVLGA